MEKQVRGQRAWAAGGRAWPPGSSAPRDVACYPRLTLGAIVIPCEHCETPYDPIGTRWKCPHCGFKNHCCGW